MVAKSRAEREEQWRRRLDPTYKPRRQPITLQRIVDTAFAIMAKDGYEALSMRRIAQDLGTGPASLYAHVENKAELDRILIDEMARGFDPPTPDPEHWQDQVKDVMRNMRAAMNAHPGIARAVIGVIPTSEEPMRTAEGLAAIMRSGGVPDQVVAWALDLLSLYVTAVAFEESVQRLQGKDLANEADLAEYVDEVRGYFESMSTDTFPNLASMAAVMTSGGTEERFEFGLSVLVAGLAAVSDSWVDPAEGNG